MNICRFLVAAARRAPEHAAVSCGSRVVYTYRELNDRVRSLASWLNGKLGLASGDRVALVMENCHQYLEIRYAAWYAGLIVVPVNSKLHAKEFEFVLQDSGSAVCFVTTNLMATITAAVNKCENRVMILDVNSDQYKSCFSHSFEANLVDLDCDHVAWLFYTSGTTGRPKGVMITHENMVAGAVSYFADVDQIDSSDSILHAAPFSHGSGFYDLPHVMRNANQIFPLSGHFDVGEVLDLLEHWRGVTMFLAPTMIKRLCRAQENRSKSLLGLKTIVYGGGPMYVEDIKDALKVVGPKFVQIYGQGEAPMTITCLSKSVINQAYENGDEDRLASVGCPHSVVDVKVVDGELSPLPAGELGEVAVRGAVVAKGYWNNPAATQDTWREGWLLTGDIGFFDQSGLLTLRDRSKDMIISGGTNIYPREIEEVLSLHPLVGEVAVVGRKSQEWGEDVVAFIVPTEGGAISTDDLDQLCLDHIARFKRPKDYYFVDSLPKNNYGKILKTDLRKALPQ